MYICKECGAKYKEKPDFCDCGNDTFDTVYETSPVEDVQDRKNPIDRKNLISWIIFGLCMLLSVLVLLFFPKIEEKPVTTQDTHPTAVRTPKTNIPDIETFWIDPKTGELEPAEETVSPVEQIKEIFVKPKTEPVKTQPKQTQTKKPAQTKVTQQTTQQTVKKTTTTTNTAKPNQTQPKTQTQTKTVQKNEVIKTSQPVSNMYEYVNYKNKLRNTLFSNLHLYEIKGSGKCGIEFAIDSTGKLIKRGFIYQSENKTVNDAVYKMLMRTPKVSPPPEAYKGEMIKMIFELDETSYAIDFAN